jgi:hypothetical protein
VIEGLNPYEIFLHEKKLSIERNQRKQDEEKLRHAKAIEEGKEQLKADRWHGGKKKTITV